MKIELSRIKILLVVISNFMALNASIGYSQTKVQKWDCTLESSIGINQIIVDTIFNPFANLFSLKSDEITIYEMVHGFQYQQEILSRLTEYNFEDKKCKISRSWIKKGEIKKDSRRKCCNFKELAMRLKEIELNGAQTILKACRTLPENFNDTRTILVAHFGKPILLIQMYGGYDLFSEGENDPALVSFLESYFRIVQKLR